MIYLYHLIVNDIVYYVGLTQTINKRISEHKRKKPPHEFIIKETFDDPFLASEAERKNIELFNTYKDFSKWNRDPGGNYQGVSGQPRKGVGGVKKGTSPWNKGISDERTKSNANKTAKTRKLKGSYKDVEKYLPKLYGENNHMKSPEHRKRMSELASRRYKVIKEDGTYTWAYRPL